MGYTPTKFGLFVWQQLTLLWEIFRCIMSFVFGVAMAVISPEWNYVKIFSLAIVIDYSIVCSYGYRMSLYDIARLDSFIERCLLSTTLVISNFVYLKGIIYIIIGILTVIKFSLCCRH